MASMFAADSSADARAFLTKPAPRQLPELPELPSFPSSPVTIDDVTSMLPQGIVGTPTTISYGAAGKRTYAHRHQHKSRGTLDAEINSYALRG